MVGMATSTETYEILGLVSELRPPLAVEDMMVVRGEAAAVDAVAA